MDTRKVEENLQEEKEKYCKKMVVEDEDKA